MQFLNQVTYQDLIKMWLKNILDEELNLTPLPDTDSLLWRNDHKKQFPILSELAHEIIYLLQQFLYLLNVYFLMLTII